MSPSGPPQRAPLLWLVLPFAAGIGCTGLVRAPDGAIVWLLAASAVIAIAGALASLGKSRSATAGWAACIVTGAALAGFAGAQSRAPRLRDWIERPPREIVVDVRVDRMFSSTGRNRMLYGIGEITAAPPHATELTGLRVYFSIIRRASPITPGRTGVYRLRGVVTPMLEDRPRDGFDDYLANAGVSLRLQRAVVEATRADPRALAAIGADASRRFSELLRIGLSRHPAIESVYRAMLLGEKASLAAEQETAFMRTGTFHVFSVSGLHVGVIATAIQAILLLLRVPRTVRVVAGLAALWFYVQVVGANPPAVRAFIMVAFFLARGLFGLPGNPLAALTAAALLTLLIDPLQLFSSGFQLSYLVVAALVLMGLPLAARWQSAWKPFAQLPENDWRWWRHAVRWAGHKTLGALAITTAALLGSTPATIAAFGLFTPGALLTNLVVVPIASLAIIAGFLAILSGLLGALACTELFNLAAAVLIALMERLVGQAAELPLAHFPAKFAAPWMATLAALAPLVLMLAGAGTRWRGRARGFWIPAAGLAVVMLACVRLG